MGCFLKALFLDSGVFLDLSPQLVPLTQEHPHTRTLFGSGGCIGSMLQIHIDNIEHISSHGFENTIHDIMRTMHTLIQQHHTQAYGRGVVQTAHELSVSVIIRLFCESGLLQGEKSELLQVQQMFLSLGPRCDRVATKNVSIAAVLRDVTCVVMRGNMFAELPIVRDICCQNVASAMSGLETESWSSLKYCVSLGEVLRLSFVLEENLKKRAIVDDHLIDVIMHDVVENALVVLQNMTQCEPPFAAHAARKREKGSLSHAISRSMVDTMVTAVLRMETPGVAQYAHSLFCVNLLELYGEQYMQWGAHKNTLSRRRSPTSKNNDTFRILEKQALLIKTIKLHGLEMVHEQVRKMITNVSGLFSRNTDITCCTHEMNLHMDASLHVLCTNQTPQMITRAVLQYDTENKGIHLLRESATFAPKNDTYARNTYARNVQRLHFEAHEHFFPCTHTTKAWHVRPCTTEMIPSNLWYILKNIKPMLSNAVGESDPRRGIIRRLRHGLVVLYLEIVYNLWTSQYIPKN